MDSNQTGDHAEIYTILQLMDRGYRVAIPYGQTKGFDLLVETRSRKWKRVQVKKIQKRGEGYRLYLMRGNAVSGRKKYTKNEFDLLIAVLPEEEKFWILPYKEVKNKTCLNLPPNPKEKWGLLK